jgi:hypothetical protein
MGGGNNNTLIGSGIPDGMSQGSGNTYIADPSFIKSHDSLAIGYGAKAGVKSISIGAGAGAGQLSERDVVFQVMQNLQSVMDPANAASPEAQKAAMELMAELNKPNRDNGVIARLWSAVSAAATIDGATGFITNVSSFLGAIGLLALPPR